MGNGQTAAPWFRMLEREVVSKHNASHYFVDSASQVLFPCYMNTPNHDNIRTNIEMKLEKLWGSFSIG
jgi:hypothetical protein